MSHHDVLDARGADAARPESRKPSRAARTMERASALATTDQAACSAATISRLRALTRVNIGEVASEEAACS